MTTATPTDIPTLTQIEIDAAIASIEPGAPPPLQLAAQLKLAPQELIEILARPRVAAFAEAARAFVSARADILARYTHITALQNLAEIAQNKEADIHSRLHAAIAILRDVRGAGGAPAHTITAPARLSHTTASPASRFRLPPPPPLRATPAPQPPSAAPPAPPRPPAQEPKPHPRTTTDSAPAAALPTPSARSPAATPLAIHRAAGAPLAARDHHPDRDPHTDAASPPATARPP